MTQGDNESPSRPDDAKPSSPMAGLTSSGHVRRTRTGTAWVGAVATAVLALMLLIFIAQNSDKVAIRFFGFDGRISLAVALLLSSAISVLIVAIPGGARIHQLRRDLRKNSSREH